MAHLLAGQFKLHVHTMAETGSLNDVAHLLAGWLKLHVRTMAEAGSLMMWLIF